MIDVDGYNKRSIIESHGGRLWVANNETGGATVAFTLRPAASQAP
jgi:signal transduction histidine kinase